MKESCFRRLRWKTPWMFYGVFGSIWGIWCLVHQIWNGFNLISTLMGLVCLLGFGPIVLCCLETVSIGEKEVALKLGSVVLRRIPVSPIRTVTSVSIGMAKGRGGRENVVILSTKRLDEMIFTPSEHPRESLLTYYESKMRWYYLPGEEGIWLQYTGDEIAKLFPNAEKYILKSEKS